jgi:hypothetical protein
LAGPSQRVDRSPPSSNSRTQKATTANTSNASPVPSSSPSAPLLSGRLSDPERSGLAGIDVMLVRALSPLPAMAQAAVPCEARGGSVCACQLAKADAPATSMSSTTTRGEAAGRGFLGGSILRADPHRRQNNGCPSHASVPFPVELARVTEESYPRLTRSASTSGTFTFCEPTSAAARSASA